MPSRTRKHRKRAAFIYSNNCLLEQFWSLINAPHYRDRLYVYRIVDETLAKPAVYAGTPISWIEETLRDEYGGGDFLVMIRRGETMILVGEIAIAVPLHGRKR